MLDPRVAAAGIIVWLLSTLSVGELAAAGILVAVTAAAYGLRQRLEGRAAPA
jgi:hypothetical protein